ncbi:MarR family transcriptional regulator [Streptomyces sp. RKND-216]|uniref:GbsR/MarR family transcriptional regulator n=1 Tax=Streptomyces sp. RKND-216 TaxID=2562581 RepID=UPI001FFBDC39|nr:MarR family transcriptional regulator [Streptomyces sp. RKND-216]
MSADDYATRLSPFVERFAADLTEAGMQRMAARVFACLLASDEGALSSAELADRLQVSPAAVSGAVRYLAGVHMVSRERAPGSRRELYRVQEDVWWETFTNRDVLLSRWSATARAGAEAIGPDTPAGRRLKETGEFFAFLKDELSGLMARWRELRAERARSGD